MGAPFIIVLLSLSIIHGSLTQESIPFIVWSNQKFLEDVPTTPTGTIIDSQYAMSGLIDSIMQNNQLVVLFNFNKISVDDISKYGSVYVQDSDGGSLSNFKIAYENSTSHMPLLMVEPGLSKEIEAEASDHTIRYHDQWESKLTGGHVDLLQVPLELTADSDSSLRKADDIIKEVLDVTSDLGLKYTAILTAERPNKIPSTQSDETDFIVGRHLLVVDDDADYSQVVTFDIAGCEGLLYVSRIDVIIEGKLDHSVKQSTTWNVSKSDCKSDNNKIKLVMFIETFKLQFNITKVKSGYYWNFEGGNVTFNDTKGNHHDIAYHIQPTDTPLNFSYHCGDMILSDKAQNPASQVNLLNFQIQPFGVKDNTFARANDCVGFFTEGIWMGLVTTLILVLILYFGVSMLASLTVMDQFDDPKGKTITVNVAD